MTSNLAESPAQPSVDKPRLPARVLGLIGADQILSQSLYFAVMPVLPLLLTMKLGGEQKQFVAWAISALTLMTRGGTLFVASLLHRLSVRGCVRIALALICHVQPVGAYPRPRCGGPGIQRQRYRCAQLHHPGYV